MSHLPVIIGFGGINSAGRASFHHAYQRMVLDSLPSKVQEETIVGLATLMNLVSYQNGGYIDDKGGKLTVADIVKKFVIHLISAPYL